MTNDELVEALYSLSIDLANGVEPGELAHGLDASTVLDMAAERLDDLTTKPFMIGD